MESAKHLYHLLPKCVAALTKLSNAKEAKILLLDEVKILLEEEELEGGSLNRFNGATEKLLQLAHRLVREFLPNQRLRTMCMFHF
jgi:hypothetical protein